jgi:hypothetical protein
MIAALVSHHMMLRKAGTRKARWMVAVNLYLIRGLTAFPRQNGIHWMRIAKIY